MTGRTDDADRADPGSASSAPTGAQRLSAAKPGLGKTVLAEIGPYFIFLIGYLTVGIFWATGLFMAATALAVAHSTRKAGKLPTFGAISTGLVALFGGLTLILGEETFIKIKPTVSNLFFAAVLGGGLLVHYYPLQRAFGHHLALAQAKWVRLSVHVAVFLACLAALNEFIRLSFSTDVWVMFKVFGLLPLNALFGLSQYYLVRRWLTAGATS